MSDPIDESVQPLIDKAFQAGHAHGYEEAIVRILDAVMSCAKAQADSPAKPTSIVAGIEDLNLTVRMYNILQREGIQRLLDLYLLCRSGGLREVRNISDRDVAQLAEALERHGYPVGIFGL